MYLIYHLPLHQNSFNSNLHLSFLERSFYFVFINQHGDSLLLEEKTSYYYHLNYVHLKAVIMRFGLLRFLLHLIQEDLHPKSILLILFDIDFCNLHHRYHLSFHPSPSNPYYKYLFSNNYFMRYSCFNHYNSHLSWSFEVSSHSSKNYYFC